MKKRVSKMENFVKRFEDVLSEEELRKEDPRIDKIIEPSREGNLQKKRKLSASTNKIQKLSSPLEAVPPRTEMALCCSFCSRRLKITNNYSCRCGHLFCIRHRFHDQHGCSFDYKSEALAKLKAENPKIVRKKIGDM
jgi:hypothetical protein